MRGVNFLAVALAAMCVIGCGEDSAPQPPDRTDRPLTVQERRAAERAVGEIRAYCRSVARYLAGGGPRPAQADAVAAAERIAGIARAKPDAPFRGSQSARQLAGDLAEDLEGTNCSEVLVVALERGL